MGQQETVVSCALRRIILALAIAALMATASAGPAAAGTVFHDRNKPGQSGDVGDSSLKNSPQSSGSTVNHFFDGTCVTTKGGKFHGQPGGCI